MFLEPFEINSPYKQIPPVIKMNNTKAIQENTLATTGNTTLNSREANSKTQPFKSISDSLSLILMMRTVKFKNVNLIGFVELILRFLPMIGLWLMLLALLKL